RLIGEDHLLLAAFLGRDAKDLGDVFSGPQAALLVAPILVTAALELRRGVAPCATPGDLLVRKNQALAVLDRAPDDHAVHKDHLDLLDRLGARQLHRQGLASKFAVDEGDLMVAKLEGAYVEPRFVVGARCAAVRKGLVARPVASTRCESDGAEP